LLSSNWRGREIPLAFAGEHNGQRLAGISFDLAAESLLSADNVNLLLMFVNLIDWLVPADSHVLIRHTGEVYTSQGLPDQMRRVVDPSGQVTVSPPGESLRIELLHAGEYLVATDHDQHRLYANFVDPIESDIGRDAPEALTDRQPGTGTAPPKSGKTPFDGWLYALAATFFFVEWIVALRT
jgi:hypothetical protein